MPSERSACFGTRARMHQYAADMALLTRFILPRGKRVRATFAARKLENTDAE